MGMVSRQDLVTLSAAAALGGGLMAIAFSAGAHWNQLQSLRPVAVVSEIAGGEEEAAARRKKFASQKWFRSMFNLPPPRLVQATATVIDQNTSFLKVSGGQQCEIEELEMSLGVGEELSYQNGNGAACLSKVSSTHKPDPLNPSKREGYLSWDDYFMSIAFLSAKRSKDPNRQVGACIVSQDRVILGIGYNGFPRGCSDDELPWAKVSVRGDPLETKYPYVCHAEVNAILNKNHASAAGQRLYVTLFPCNECAKVIIQAGIAEVVYFADKGVHTDNKIGGNEAAYVASRKLLAMAGVKVWQHQPVAKMLVLEFK